MRLSNAVSKRLDRYTPEGLHVGSRVTLVRSASEQVNTVWRVSDIQIERLPYGRAMPEVKVCILQKGNNEIRAVAYPIKCENQYVKWSEGSERRKYNKKVENAAELNRLAEVADQMSSKFDEAIRKASKAKLKTKRTLKELAEL